ncbi:hypothetical protein PAI11_16310 [Patulibacter medicamentivorans]|uniref:Uncharacterized protein n=1 Tax=Patulibacter medicamentivorans TaxID=1097667 RepID=H0E4A4_9ACTN|nr:hypothetical protein PAI11_16310 [Patulibacter medicamentivorans]
MGAGRVGGQDELGVRRRPLAGRGEPQPHRAGGVGSDRVPVAAAVGAEEEVVGRGVVAVADPHLRDVQVLVTGVADRHRAHRAERPGRLVGERRGRRLELRPDRRRRGRQRHQRRVVVGDVQAQVGALRVVVVQVRVADVPHLRQQPRRRQRVIERLQLALVHEAVALLLGRAAPEVGERAALLGDRQRRLVLEGVEVADRQHLGALGLQPLGLLADDRGLLVAAAVDGRLRGEVVADHGQARAGPRLDVERQRRPVEQLRRVAAAEAARGGHVAPDLAGRAVDDDAVLDEEPDVDPARVEALLGVGRVAADPRRQVLQHLQAGLAAGGALAVADLLDRDDLGSPQAVLDRDREAGQLLVVLGLGDGVQVQVGAGREQVLDVEARDPDLVGARGGDRVDRRHRRVLGHRRLAVGLDHQVVVAEAEAERAGRVLDLGEEVAADQRRRRLRADVGVVRVAGAGVVDQRQQARARVLAEDALLGRARRHEQLAELRRAAAVGRPDRERHAHPLERLVVGPVAAAADDLGRGLGLVDRDRGRDLAVAEHGRLLAVGLGDHRQAELLLDLAGDPGLLADQRRAVVARAADVADEDALRRAGVGVRVGRLGLDVDPGVLGEGLGEVGADLVVDPGDDALDRDGLAALRARRAAALDVVDRGDRRARRSAAAEVLGRGRGDLEVGGVVVAVLGLVDALAVGAVAAGAGERRQVQAGALAAGAGGAAGAVGDGAPVGPQQPHARHPAVGEAGRVGGVGGDAAAVAAGGGVGEQEALAGRQAGAAGHGGAVAGRARARRAALQLPAADVDRRGAGVVELDELVVRS